MYTSEKKKLFSPPDDVGIDNRNSQCTSSSRENRSVLFALVPLFLLVSSTIRHRCVRILIDISKQVLCAMHAALYLRTSMYEYVCIEIYVDHTGMGRAVRELVELRVEERGIAVSWFAFVCRLPWSS